MDLEKAADSTLSKAIARWITPILLAAIGWLIVGKLDSQDETLKELQTGQREAEVAQVKTSGQVERLDAKIDGVLLYQVTDLQKRVETLERASRVP